MRDDDVRLSLRSGLTGGIAAGIDRARTAEVSGFDQIWFGNDTLGTSGVVALSAMAAATSRIGLGIGVVEPVSMHPVQIAMVAAGLQELSGGRFLLGLGAGSAVFLGSVGLHPPPPVTRTSQALVAIRALLDGRSPADEPGAGAGWTEHARLHTAPPLPAPPIYVGAMGPKMLGMAGRLADGALPLCLPPERFARARALIQSGADAAERDLRDFDLAACVWCSIDDDAERARRQLAGFIAKYSGSLSPDALAEEGFDPDEFAHVQRLVLDEGLEAATDAVGPAMLRLGIAGGPHDVVEHCRRLIDAGARHLSFGPPLGADPDRAIQVIGDQVVPVLRGGGTGR